jgi:hypothetical protein
MLPMPQAPSPFPPPNVTPLLHLPYDLHPQQAHPGTYVALSQALSSAVHCNLRTWGPCPNAICSSMSTPKCCALSSCSMSYGGLGMHFTFSPLCRDSCLHGGDD